MYIPKVNQFADLSGIIEFMRRFSFATIITADNRIPVATHLPFIVSEEKSGLVLYSHFARANPQWEDITKGRALIIFTEPHAYISTSHYEKELNVPTWNYISIHVYGKGHLIEGAAEAMSVIDATAGTYDQEFSSKWKTFPIDYKKKMMKGIVAFRIEVDDIQAKKKLSQNKSEAEQSAIIGSLKSSDDGSARLIAEYMSENHKKTI